MQRWCRRFFFLFLGRVSPVWEPTPVLSSSCTFRVQNPTMQCSIWQQRLPTQLFPGKKLGRGQFQLQFSSHKNAYISIFLWRLKEFLGLGKGGGIKVNFTPHKSCRRLFTKGPSLTAIRDSPEAEISEEEGCSEGKVCFFTAYFSHPTCVHHYEMLS